MQQLIEQQEDSINPIDSVEDILNANNWTFNRPNSDELVVEVSGKNSKYNLSFIWQDNMNALQFACHHNVKIALANINEAHAAILSINENLWLGHFDIPNRTQKPIFRHTCLLRKTDKATTTEVIEDMVDIALIQCERYYSVFQLLSENTPILSEENMQLALMETAGES